MASPSPCVLRAGSPVVASNLGVVENDVAGKVGERRVMFVPDPPKAPRAGVDGDASSGCRLRLVVCDADDNSPLPFEEGRIPARHS
jgi:hypothetical protein